MVRLYVRDIENALNNKCYFPALALSLALPDICGTAEYPNETSAGKRYIEWYNKYIGAFLNNDCNAPYLSGEVVYNLRNTFLHSGSPNIDSSKVKDEINQVDKFVLILGDGTKICSVAQFIETKFRSAATGIEIPIVNIRVMKVDVTYLCHTICDSSLLYFNQYPEKFHFDFNIDLDIDDDKLISDKLESMQGDPMIKEMNQKLEKTDNPIRIKETPNFTPTKDIISGIDFVLSNEQLKQRFLKGESVTLVKNSVPAQLPVIGASKNEQPIPKINSSTPKKQMNPDKREAQVRSFFGEHFKEKQYNQKKELIIQAILKSKTKLQVNNLLMKSFTSEETGVIYKRISPLILSLPGK